MDLRSRRADAVSAAVAAGAAAGYRRSRPVVLQETNNVVVWLKPHDVVAKAGIWSHSADVLRREVEVCAHLRRCGAPVATPIGGLQVVGPAQLPVSLWERLDNTERATYADAAVAELIAEVHEGLASYGKALPSWRVALELARTTLRDDDRMRALPPVDLHLLREAYDLWVPRAASWPVEHRPLHGEPHDGNIIASRRGPVLIDFEGACTGPLEWDVSFLPDRVSNAFPADRDLLVLLRNLNCARVATWCWAQAEHPQMRAHGELHLGIIRRALA